MDKWLRVCEAVSYPLNLEHDHNPKPPTLSPKCHTGTKTFGHQLASLEMPSYFHEVHVPFGMLFSIMAWTLQTALGCRLGVKMG